MASFFDFTARSEADYLDAWLRRHAVLMLAAGTAAAATRTGAWIAAAGTASFGLLWLRHGGSGLANHITAARLTGLLLAASALDRLPHTWLIALLAANVVGDVLDGYVARRRRETTAFGTVLDREADAVFVLVVYLYFVVVIDVEVWLAAFGLLPYAYRLVSACLPNAVPSDHKERAAAWLAGVNFALLMAALVRPSHAHELLLASAAIVLSSFSLSFWTLFRHARSLPQ